jgi:hypothetical protein
VRKTFYLYDQWQKMSKRKWSGTVPARDNEPPVPKMFQKSREFPKSKESCKRALVAAKLEATFYRSIVAAEREIGLGGLGTIRNMVAFADNENRSLSETGQYRKGSDRLRAQRAFHVKHRQ